MLRMLALGAVAAVASIPVAPAAHADPICQSVVLTGTVEEPFGSCLPYGDDVTCDTTHAGTDLETVWITICFPSLGATP